MAEFKVVSEKDAPKPNKQTGRLANRMREYESRVSAVRPGQVGILTPEGNETVRGLALRVSRAGKRVGKNVETWVSDNSVCFKVS